MSKKVKEVRFETDNPNVDFVIRIANGGFQFVKETKVSSGEVLENNVSVEQIEVKRVVGQEINDFPTN